MNFRNPNGVQVYELDEPVNLLLKQNVHEMEIG